MKGLVFSHGWNIEIGLKKVCPLMLDPRVSSSSFFKASFADGVLLKGNSGVSHREAYVALMLPLIMNEFSVHSEVVRPGEGFIAVVALKSQRSGVSSELMSVEVV